MEAALETDSGRIDDAIREALAPYPDGVTAYRHSGLHPDHPLETTRGDARLRLLISARDAFAEKGYRGTSTRDIAAGAGMSATAMYVHYQSKQAVLVKLCVLGNAAALETMRDAIMPADSPAKRLRAAVYAFAHWHAENHTIGRIVQWEISSLQPANFRIVAAQRRDIDATLRGILVDGARNGDFVVADLAATTLAILSFSIDIVRWFPSRTINTPETIAASYAALAEAMVSPRQA